MRFLVYRSSIRELVRVSDKFIKYWNVFKLFNFDFKYMFKLFVWLIIFNMLFSIVSFHMLQNWVFIQECHFFMTWVLNYWYWFLFLRGLLRSLSLDLTHYYFIFFTFFLSLTVDTFIRRINSFLFLFVQILSQLKRRLCGCFDEIYKFLFFIRICTSNILFK